MGVAAAAEHAAGGTLSRVAAGVARSVVAPSAR